MKFDIDRILKLSMLELDEEEKEFLSKEMEKIIEWVSKLEELEIEGEEMTFITITPLREDKPQRPLKREEIISPYNHEGIFFVVPKVVEK